MLDLKDTDLQETLLNVTKIVETECAKDASQLLNEGFVLLAVAKNIYEDDGNRFVYSLGFIKPIGELSDWARDNF
ncbi:hypothetical protein AAEU32_15120 [Pseudoalteromonas sp. SSDWG2]|uniref:hypothetical protein n=1 Tax=Pseudoalteromonas sp. SSDWG2 TaxID=3139391 RepID=UPI003BACD931